VVDIAPEHAQTDVTQYVKQAEFRVVRQERRIARLAALGLETEHAFDTLDVFKGTAQALESFDRLLRVAREGLMKSQVTDGDASQVTDGDGLALSQTGLADVLETVRQTMQAIEESRDLLRRLDSQGYGEAVPRPSAPDTFSISRNI
jgi:hypothetical protein